MTARIKALQQISAGLITAAWLGCFCICLAVPCIMRLKASIESDNVMAALGGISDAYSANLAVILGFYFHKKLRSKKTAKPFPASLPVALAATFIWNALTVGTFLSALLNLIPIEDATKTISSIGPKLSWLVASMLGYYFAGSKDE